MTTIGPSPFGCSPPARTTPAVVQVSPSWLDSAQSTSAYPGQSPVQSTQQAENATPTAALPCRSTSTSRTAAYTFGVGGGTTVRTGSHPLAPRILTRTASPS